MNWLVRHRAYALALICIFWTTLMLLTLLFSEVPFFSTIARSDQSFGDMLRREGRKTATRPDMIFLGIDEATLNFVPFNPDDVADNRAFQIMTAHPFPWSREIWSLLLDRLFASGARLVLFDLIFGKPAEGDAEFHAALDRYRDKVVLGANIDRENNDVLVWPSSTLIPDAPHDDRAGYVIYFPDELDQRVRSIRYLISDRMLAGLDAHPSQEIFHSLAARALEKLGRADAVPRDLTAKLIRFSSLGAYHPKSLAEIFDPAVWHANYHDGADFKDKIVMIGAASQVAHDVVDTPVSPSMSGPILHLHSIAAALDNQFLRLTPVRLRYVLVFAAGVAAWVIVTFVRRPLASLVCVSVVAIAYLVVARVLYDQTGLLLMTVPVLGAFVLSGSFSLGWDYVLERREKLRTRRTLERYVSKNLVSEILDNPSGYYNSLKGKRLPITALFADLIGFTNLAEHSEPEQLVSHLNELLSEMVKVVFEHDGTVDKFIGDAIMAVWGNVRSAGVHADAKAAAMTALGMRRALKELNQRWREEGKMPLGMGIGINHGDAVVGNIGSYAPHERLDPTVIGDAVNLASRLEALTRTYGVDILVGEAATELIRDDFVLRSVARVQVKGKSIPVAVSTILCATGEEYDAEFLKWLVSYEDAIAKFRGRDFTQAKILLARFLEFYPDDYLAKMYLDRALEYEQQPPDESWNAAEIFTKK